MRVPQRLPFHATGPLLSAPPGGRALAELVTAGQEPGCTAGASCVAFSCQIYRSRCRDIPFPTVNAKNQDVGDKWKR